MIIINTLDDIEKAEITPKELKEEILQHFQEIAESVVDKYWRMYNLKEVGDIVLNIKLFNVKFLTLFDVKNI